MMRSRFTVPGEEWVAGDHSIFAFSGIPCVAVTSSDMEDLFAITHTAADTSEMVDSELLEAAADFGSDLVQEVSGA